MPFVSGISLVVARDRHFGVPKLIPTISCKMQTKSGCRQDSLININTRFVRRRTRWKGKKGGGRISRQLEKQSPLEMDFLRKSLIPSPCL
jgi:hypothetical protein